MKRTVLFVLAIGLLSANFLSAQSLTWAKKMGGTNTQWGKAIAVDKQKNTYVTCWFKGTADFDPGPAVYSLTSAGLEDIVIFKLDSSGNFLWAERLGSSSYDNANAIAVDSLGNIYLTGYFQGTVDFDPGQGTFNLTSQGSNDVFICKLDASGSFIWAKSMGGTDSDYGSRIAMDGTGAIYITGVFRITCDFDPGPGITNLTSAGMYDGFVTKLDASGNLLWARKVGGTGDDYPQGLAVDKFGVYTTGRFHNTADFDPGAGVLNLTSAGSEDIFVCKLDPSGNLVWAERAGASLWDYSYGIALDPLGYLYITGYFQKTVDFDPGAGISSLTAGGFEDAFVLKLDINGNYVWARNLGGRSTGDDAVAYAIALDGFGNIWTTGSMIGLLDVDPGADSMFISTGTYGETFISELSPSGNYIWGSHFIAGHGFNESYGIISDQSSNIYITGTFTDSVDFDPGQGSLYLKTGGSDDIYVVRLGNQEVNQIDKISGEGNNIVIYPNPAKEDITIRNESHIEKPYEIMDIMGRTVKKGELHVYRTTISIKELPEGIYIIKIGGEFRKFIKKE